MTNTENSVVKKYRPRGKTSQDVVRSLNTTKGIIVDKYLLKVFEEQGFEFDPEVDNRSVYNPEALFDALSHYQKRPLSYDKEVFDQAVKIAYSAFGGDGSLSNYDLNSGLKPFIKLEKSSGLPLAATKGAAFESDLALARKNVLEGKAFPPCIAYHRIQFGEKGPKTRLVWGYPLSVTLLESMFARPLIEKFLNTSSPMAFGYRKMELSAVTQRLRNCGLTYCLDFSKFDSSICSKFIHIAFRIMKTHFREFDEFTEEVWNRVESYFIHTTILMPDGFVYQKHGGVPSGSYFTQLVDSIVNFIAMQYISIKTTGDGIPERWGYVLGDDSIFTLKEYVNLTEIVRFGKQLGLLINADKSVVAKESEEVHFLGHYWPHGVASRSYNDLVKRMITSERASKLPIPDQRGMKVFAFLGDCKEGSLLSSRLEEAQLKRLRYGKALYTSSVPKGTKLDGVLGSLRALEAAGVKCPDSSKFRKLGLWIS